MAEIVATNCREHAQVAEQLWEHLKTHGLTRDEAIAVRDRLVAGSGIAELTSGSAAGSAATPTGAKPSAPSNIDPNLPDPDDTTDEHAETDPDDWLRGWNPASPKSWGQF